MTCQLTKGQIFSHKHWLNPDMSGAPLQCKVTRIAQGVIYYRPFYGTHEDGSEWLGSAAYFPVEDTCRYVRESA